MGRRPLASCGLYSRYESFSAGVRRQDGRHTLPFLLCRVELLKTRHRWSYWGRNFFAQCFTAKIFVMSSDAYSRVL